MTTISDMPPLWANAVANGGVYPPQHDSRLLVQAMERSAIVAGRRVLDLCTGSGVVAIAAAELGAASVTAFDICPRAVRCARVNTRTAGVEVDVRQGPWIHALGCAPFDVIVANPPYVPTAPDAAVLSPAAGSPWTWDGGGDGRRVLGPLCQSASALLSAGGSLLLVQSELSGIEMSLETLRTSGLDVEVIASQLVPFGPVLSALAGWLEAELLIQPGCREEQLVVIRADKP